MKKDKYDIDKLPIRDELRDKIKNQRASEIAAIDWYQAFARMLSLQDDAYDEQFDNLFKGMCELNKKMNSLIKLVKKTSDALMTTEQEVSKLKDVG